MQWSSAAFYAPFFGKAWGVEYAITWLAHRDRIWAVDDDLLERHARGVRRRRRRRVKRDADVESDKHADACGSNPKGSPLQHPGRNVNPDQAHTDTDGAPIPDSHAGADTHLDGNPQTASAVTFLSLGSTPNSYQGTIVAASQYGIIDTISTDEIISTTGANPALATDPIALTLSTSAGAFAHARVPTATADALPSWLALGTLRYHRTGSAIRLRSIVREPDDTALAHQVLALPRRSAGGLRIASGLRRTTSLGTIVGSTTSFYVNTASIGQAGNAYTLVPATLVSVSNHGYIWIDNTLSLPPSSINQIATDFDNAYASDTTHFGTPEYTTSSPQAQDVTQPCDANGNQIPGATPVPEFIPPPNGMHVVFVINTQALGDKVGGYFSLINYLPQAAANCVAGQPQSNEASMIYVGYNLGNTDAFEIQEDLVRGTSHEFQHLINFVNNVILSTSPQNEDRWINEGLSMLAQDFGVHNLYPQVSVDVDDALNHAIVFMNNPQNFSLTGFTGVDPGTTTLAYNCTGCYGAEYLFQRYLYDQYGNDTYTHNMESGGTVSYAGLQAQTGTNPKTLIENFSVALAISGTGVTSTPAYNFTNFNPYASYTDQFGDAAQLNGPAAETATIGATTSNTPYLGTFYYALAQPATGQGAGVTETDTAGTFGLAPALIQF